MSRLSGSRLNPLIVLACEKTSGTNGGANTAGAWATREINVKSVDTAGICTLASNQFTLPPGRYVAMADAHFFACDGAQIRFYNVTGAAQLILGQIARYGAALSMSFAARAMGVFDLAATSAVRLEYIAATVSSPAGLGVAQGLGTEVFAQIMLEKVR